MTLTKLIETLRCIREEVGKKEMPLYWLEFMLIVAEAGEEGITTIDVVKRLGEMQGETQVMTPIMTQGIASRMVKLMSRYYNPVKKEVDGLDIFETRPDLVNRHRQRVVLTEKGISIMKKAGLL